ncbi:MAG TPA: helix-hairpin-helix domain-containing protein, partial [Blastocatellia bacterium]|nr:helix-hairpin-helix domain-containing protein [Blastocatellia bacterium]
LTSIPGVGEKLKERLLRNFGSLRRVSEASVAELRPFVGQIQAERIVEHFAQQRQESVDVNEQEERDQETD